MNIEGGSQPEIMASKEPRYDVRVVPFGVRSLPELTKDIQMLNQDEKLPLFEVYLSQQINILDNSKQPIIPFGGQIDRDEMRNIEKAGLKRLKEKSTLTVVPYKDKMPDVFAFEYKDKPESPVTKIYFKSAFVINPDILPAVSLQSSSDAEPNTDIEMVPMILTDFKKSMKTGEYKGQKLAAITSYSNPNDEIVINESDQDRRETFLKMLTLSIKEKEEEFRKKLTNRLLIDALRNNVHVENGSNSLESILKKIQENGNLDTILKSSLDRIIREDYMDYFRKTEKEQYTKKVDFEQLENIEPESDIIKNELDLIKDRIVNGNFGTDLLHFIPLYTQANMHPEARTTRLINTSARFVRDSIKHCLGKAKLEGVNTFEDAKKLVENPEVALSKKFDFFKKMDEQMLELLADKLGKTKRYITRAWFESQKFIPEIGEIAKSVDPNLYNIYQFHELRNEVANASMVQTMLFGLGIDTKNNNTEHLKRIRFEALRQLTIFSKFLFESDVYERKTQQGINPIHLAMNNFFGPVETVEHIEFVNESNGMHYNKPIERRRDHNGTPYIIDKKPMKPLQSYIRKSFETKHTGISDLFSTSVILTDEKNKNLSHEDKVLLINNRASEFLQYLKTNYPDYKISISGDKNTFGNFTALRNGEEVEKKGVRTGSQGSLIIRRKMYVTMNRREGDVAEEYTHELVFYPFEKMEDIPAGGMLTWRDTIADGPSYVGKRLMESLQNAYGLNSLHGLFFPSVIYPELAKKMRDHIALENGSKVPKEKKKKII